MKKLYTNILLLLVFQTAMTQYNPKESMFGIRAGGAVGLTYKKFFGHNFAFEVITAHDFPKEDKGVFVSTIFAKHASLSGKKFSALIGAGPSYHFRRESLGLAGIIGFDWRIVNSPINIQVDWSPALYFRGEHPFSYVNTALSMRYILNSKRVNGHDN